MVIHGPNIGKGSPKSRIHTAESFAPVQWAVPISHIPALHPCCVAWCYLSGAAFRLRSVAIILFRAYLSLVMPSLLENVRVTLARRLAPPDSTQGEELLRPLPSIIGLNQLLGYLSATLAELLDVSSVSILLYEPLTGRFSCRRGGGADPEQSGKLHFHENDRTMQWLKVLFRDAWPRLKHYE